MSSNGNFLDIINELQSNKESQEKIALNETNDNFGLVEISYDEFKENLDKLNHLKNSYQNGKIIITKDCEIYNKIKLYYSQIIRYSNITTETSINIHCIWFWIIYIDEKLNKNIDITLETVPTNIFIPSLGLIKTIPRFMILISEKEQIKIINYIIKNGNIKFNKFINPIVIKSIIEKWKFNKEQAIFLYEWLLKIINKIN